MKVLSGSLKEQLILWLMIPILMLGFLQGCVAYYLGTNFANNSFDESLGDIASALSSQLKIKGQNVKINLSPSAKSILEYDDDDKIFYQVLGLQGQFLDGDPRFPKLKSLTDLKGPDYQNGRLDHQKVRIVSMESAIPGVIPLRNVIVQVAKSATDRVELSHSILMSVVIPQFLLVLFSWFIIWFGVIRGLSPLEKLCTAVRNRTPRNLAPINPIEAPREVLPLVHAINDLLGRVEADLNIHRRFVANSAHQLKTPLAGLQAQAEFALKQTQPEDIQQALSQVHISAQRAGRLVEQLLSLARSEQDEHHLFTQKFVDLNQIVRNVMIEHVPHALQKKIDLIFEENDSSEISVLGDQTSLYELTSNLMDNALRYTQNGGQVVVRIGKETGRVVLTVSDNGPGIPLEKRDHVFERFYRVLGNATEGSGLGLAIVREIARAHHAEIEMCEGLDNQGISIRVTFPVA